MSTPYQSAPAGPPASEPPRSNLVWAILTTIFCCVPFGIVSIVYAAQVNSKWAVGDVAGAQESSSKARRWAIFAAIGGVVTLVLWGAAVAAGLLALPETTTAP